MESATRSTVRPARNAGGRQPGRSRQGSPPASRAPRGSGRGRQGPLRAPRLPARRGPRPVRSASRLDRLAGRAPGPPSGARVRGAPGRSATGRTPSATRRAPWRPGPRRRTRRTAVLLERLADRPRGEIVVAVHEQRGDELWRRDTAGTSGPATDSGARACPVGVSRALGLSCTRRSLAMSRRIGGARPALRRRHPVGRPSRRAGGPGASGPARPVRRSRRPRRGRTPGVAELEECAPDPRLGGTERNPSAFGDFDVGQAADERELERPPLIRTPGPAIAS